MSRIPVPASPSHSVTMSSTSGTTTNRTPSQSTSIYSPSHLSSTSNPPTPIQGSQTETRKRQSKRDEAIRRKIESDLSRKRPTSTKQQQQQQSSRRPGSAQPSRPKQGTVSALRPLPALTVPHSISVADASQLCAAKRTDCVLVVDEEEHLCGIFTAKDLAFRVVGDGLDPRSTPVSAIMTPNPMVTRDSTSATDALQTMVTRGFRHLPVCNEDGDVVGLLDITKVFHESLEKLERAYGSSQKLYHALEGVQSEWGSTGGGSSSSADAGPSGLMAYVEALREKMSFPDLGSILDARTAPAMVTVKTTVREAAKLMRERRTTAVCVMENDGKKIAGIFTSKDVVLRVIAAGLDAKTCSVVRVMTPHPDVGTPSLSIQDALRKMHDGHYLNLPVVDDEGSLVGIVDVLKLTYATLEQVNSIGADTGAQAGGPLWGKFFGALGGADEDSESIFSGGDQSEMMPHSPSTQLLGSEVFPNDSASVVYDDERAYSDVGGRRGGAGGAHGPSSIGVGGNNGVVPPSTVDDGTYLFKFVAPGGTTHRFQARYESFDFITDIIAGKLAADPFFSRPSSSTSTTPSTPTEEVVVVPALDPRDFQLYYHDDDGDLVMITADQDIKDAVAVARAQTKDRVVIHVSGGRGWTDEMARRQGSASASAVPVVAATSAGKKSKAGLTAVGEEKEDEDEDDQEEDEEEKTTKKRTTKRTTATTGGGGEEELLFGVLKKEQLLPASVAFLAVVIIGVFSLSRATASK